MPFSFINIRFLNLKLTKYLRKTLLKDYFTNLLHFETQITRFNSKLFFILLFEVLHLQGSRRQWQEQDTKQTPANRISKHFKKPYEILTLTFRNIPAIKTKVLKPLNSLNRIYMTLTEYFVRIFKVFSRKEAKQSILKAL